jgi:hypothetical protein
MGRGPCVVVHYATAERAESDFAAHGNPRHALTRILLQVELAAPPGHSREARFAGCLQPGVVITDDELEAAQAALLQAALKLSPLHLGFRFSEVLTTPNELDVTLVLGPLNSRCFTPLPSLSSWSRPVSGSRRVKL